jgi:hypothetical protein
MRSSRVVRAPDCQCQSRNSPGFDPSILRHTEIWSADEAVLNEVHTKNLLLFKFFVYAIFLIFSGLLMLGDFLQQKREKKKFDYERFDKCSVPSPSKVLDAAS